MKEEYSLEQAFNYLRYNPRSNLLKIEITEFPEKSLAFDSWLLREKSAPYIKDEKGNYLINYVIKHCRKQKFNGIGYDTLEYLAKPLLENNDLKFDPSNNPVIVALEAGEVQVAANLLKLFQDHKVGFDTVNYILQNNKEFNKKFNQNLPKLSRHILNYYGNKHYNESGRNFIHDLIIEGQNDIVGKLLSEAQKEIDRSREEGTFGPYSKDEVQNILSSTDLDGNTPLMFAIKAGNVAICELLIKHGARVSIKDFEALADGTHVANKEKILSLLAEKVTTIDTIPQDYQKEFFEKIFKIDLSRPDLHALYKETSEKKAKAPRHKQKLYGELLNSIDETHKDRSKENKGEYLDEGSALYKLLEKNQFKALARIGGDQVKFSKEELDKLTSQVSPKLMSKLYQLADASNQREKGGGKLVFKDLLNKAANFLNSLRKLNISSKDNLYRKAIGNIETLIPNKTASIRR